MSTVHKQKKQKSTAKAQARAKEEFDDDFEDLSDDNEKGNETKVSPPVAKVEDADEARKNRLREAGLRAMQHQALKSTQPLPRTGGTQNHVTVKGWVTHIHSRKIPSSGSTQYTFHVVPKSLHAATTGSLVYPGTMADPSSAFVMPSIVVQRDKDDMYDGTKRKPDHRYAPPKPRMVLNGALLSVSRFIGKGEDASSIPSVGDTVSVNVAYNVKHTEDPLTGRINSDVPGGKDPISVLSRCAHPADASRAILKSITSDDRLQTVAYDSTIDALGGFSGAVFGDSTEMVDDAEATPKIFQDAFEERATRLTKRPECISGAIRTLVTKYNADDPNLEKSAAAANTTLAEIDDTVKHWPKPEGDRTAAPLTLHEVTAFEGQGLAPTLVLPCTANRGEWARLIHKSVINNTPLGDAALPKNRVCEAIFSTPKRGNTAVYQTGVSMKWVPSVAAYAAAFEAGDAAAYLASVNDDGSPTPRFPLKFAPSRAAAIFGTRSLSHLDVVVEELFEEMRCFFTMTVQPCDARNALNGLGGESWLGECLADMRDVLAYRGVPVSLAFVQEHLCGNERFFPGLDSVSSATLDPTVAVAPMAHFQPAATATLKADGFANLTEASASFASVFASPAQVPADRKVHYVVVLPGGGEAMEKLREQLDLTNVETIGTATPVETSAGEELLANSFCTKHGASTVSELLTSTNAVVFAYLGDADTLN